MFNLLKSIYWIGGDRPHFAHAELCIYTLPLRHGMPCHAMPCHAIPCHAMVFISTARLPTRTPNRPPAGLREGSPQPRHCCHQRARALVAVAHGSHGGGHLPPGALYQYCACLCTALCWFNVLRCVRSTPYSCSKMRILCLLAL